MEGIKYQVRVNQPISEEFQLITGRIKGNALPFSLIIQYSARKSDENRPIK